LVLATQNAGKAAELERLLRGVAGGIQSLAGLSGVFLPSEGDRSYAENALVKARALYSVVRVPAIGDDSGLEVDELDGAPGIRSARFAGEEAGDAENNALLLRRLRGVPPERRTARFRCVLAMVGAGEDLVVEGTCDGSILEAPRGRAGFGYDPLFLPAGESRSFAELPEADKDRLSHRGRAAAALREAIQRTRT
jgi:XTP/dITP diphosphohydrolase